MERQRRASPGPGFNVLCMFVCLVAAMKMARAMLGRRGPDTRVLVGRTGDERPLIVDTDYLDAL